MPGLSNIFGGDDSDSNSSSEGNILGHGMADAGNAVGLDVNSDQNSMNTDEDGSSSSNSNSNSIGLDSDTDGLLHGVTDAFGSSDESDS
jgi:hypothetical protein